MSTISTSTGTTVSINTHESDRGPMVILDNPEAPDDMRDIEVGRLAYGGRGFQPAPFLAGAMRPEVLRAIADLIEQEADQ